MTLSIEAETVDLLAWRLELLLNNSEDEAEEEEEVLTELWPRPPKLAALFSSDSGFPVPVGAVPPETAAPLLASVTLVGMLVRRPTAEYVLGFEAVPEAVITGETIKLESSKVFAVEKGIIGSVVSKEEEEEEEALGLVDTSAMVAVEVAVALRLVLVREGLPLVGSGLPTEGTIGLEEGGVTEAPLPSSSASRSIFCSSLVVGELCLLCDCGCDCCCCCCS